MIRTMPAILRRAQAALSLVVLAAALAVGFGTAAVARAQESDEPTEVDPYAEPPAGRVPYEEPPPDDSSAEDDSDDDSSLDDLGPVDPLDLYLEDLADSTASTFSDPALDSLSISDAEVDSLMRVYAATGKSPAAAAGEAERWKFKLGIADARYNRVEGFNVSPQVKIRPPVSPPVEFRGWVGYGWSAHEATGGGEMRAQMAEPGRPTLHASWARDVYSFGSGLIVGNSLTSLVFGNDYGDYFRAEGWRFGVEATSREFFVDATMRVEDQESLENAAEFSVFENDESFRPNPSIDDGELRSIDLIGSWSDRMGAPWTARARFRTAGGALGGDFDYERVRGELVARRRVWLGDRVVAALAGGWVERGAPFQGLHHLGGFETLRGYDINEYPVAIVRARSPGLRARDQHLPMAPVRAPAAPPAGVVRRRGVHLHRASPRRHDDRALRRRSGNSRWGPACR